MRELRRCLAGLALAMLATGCLSGPRYREFPATQSGAIKAVEAAARAPKVVGHGLTVYYYYNLIAPPSPGTTRAYAWEWTTHAPVDSVTTNDDGVCVPGRCIAYRDLRTVYFGAPPKRLDDPDAPAATQALVSATTFPALLHEQKARGAGLEMSIEERAPTSGFGQAIFTAVSLIDGEAICGINPNGLTKGEGYECYRFASVEKLSAWDDEKARSAADAVNDAVLAPFRVAFTVAALFGAAMP